MNYSHYDTITINGQTLKGLNIIQFCKHSPIRNVRLLGEFMTKWLSDNPSIELQTSGSTGLPKTVLAQKSQMLHSALMTAEFFEFKEGQNALLCLPVEYIAGKMMVVRALLSKLNLVCIEPNNAPVLSVPQRLVIDFAPLVPMQLNGVIDTSMFRTILLGGGPVSQAQEEQYQSLSSAIYHSYGMTETLSHIALRKLNGAGRSLSYKALSGVRFDVDEHHCLIIEVPFLNSPVYTNDVVELLNDSEFIWRGRFDNVVNSGGIKLFPEEIEKKVFPYIPERFFIAGIPDERFGEKLCMFIEGEEYNDEKMQLLMEKISGNLDKYEKPRKIYFIKNFLTTESGKIMRQATVHKVVSL